MPRHIVAAAPGFWAYDVWWDGPRGADRSGTDAEYEYKAGERASVVAWQIEYESDSDWPHVTPITNFGVRMEERIGFIPVEEPDGKIRGSEEEFSSIEEFLRRHTWFRRVLLTCKITSASPALVGDKDAVAA